MLGASCSSPWQTVQPEGGGLTIAVPGKLECAPQKQEAFGTKLMGTACSAATGDSWVEKLVAEEPWTSHYLVSWLDLPDGLIPSDEPGLLAEMKRREVALTWGAEPPATSEIGQSARVVVDGAEGLEFDITQSGGVWAENRFVVRERIFVRGRRVVAVAACGVARGKSDAFGDENWRRFADSLHFAAATNH